jgi:hypothetical protein
MVAQIENISAHFPKGSGDIILETKSNGKNRFAWIDLCVVWWWFMFKMAYLPIVFD